MQGRGLFIPGDVPRRQGERGPFKYVNFLQPGDVITFRVYPPQDPLTQIPFIYRAHYVPTRVDGSPLRRYIPCTADSPDTNGICHICKMKAEGRLKADWGKGPQRRAGLVIEDLTDYHKIETPDGKIIYERCKGARCPHCQAGIPKIKAGMRYLSLAPSALIPIQEIFRSELFAVCKECGAPMNIEGSYCSECGNMLLSAQSLQTLTEEAFISYLTTWTKCPNCGKTVLPELMFKCPSCGGTQSVELSDVVWTVRRIGKGQSTTYSISYDVDPLDTQLTPVCYKDIFSISLEGQLQMLGVQ